MKLKDRIRRTLSIRHYPSIPSTIVDWKTFLHSDPLDHVHSRPTGAFTTLPARLHKQDTQAVEFANVFSAEMTLAMGRPQPNQTCIVGSPVGHMSSLLYPESLPERLDDIAMILEGGTIVDDIMEREDMRHAADYKDMMASILGTSQGVGNLSAIRGLKGKDFVSKAMLRFTAKYGSEGALLIKTILKDWIRPMELVAKETPTCFESSVSSRISNNGARTMRGILEFSLGIVVSREETKIIQPLLNVVDRIFTNTNDYFSWDVEKDNGVRVQNSVKVIMETEGRSEEQARDQLKRTILEDEARFQQLSKQFLDAPSSIPIHVRKFIVTLEVFLGGHNIWCAACERYQICSTEGLDAKGPATGAIETNVEDIHSAASTVLALDHSALLDPVVYIASLPSKNMRSKVIDGLNIWFQLPENQLKPIKSSIDDIHNSTLILDDIQDQSYLRRGFSAAHHVFGSAQCINSATYMVARAISTVASHLNQCPQAVEIFSNGLKELALGQSWDINWKITGHCPSRAEYMAMVDGKTGAMFEIIIRLMQGLSATAEWPISKFIELGKVLGRWYQIRDDYQNLQDDQYAAQKGFCEDLDEGKLSYPLIVCCDLDPTAQRVIMGIFRQKDPMTPLTLNTKMQILDLFRCTGALRHTWDVLEGLKKDAEGILSSLETMTGERNPKLRAISSLLGEIQRPA